MKLDKYDSEFVTYDDMEKLFKLTYEEVIHFIEAENFPKYIINEKKCILVSDINSYVEVNHLKHFQENIDEYFTPNQLVQMEICSFDAIKKMRKEKSLVEVKLQNKNYIYIHSVTQKKKKKRSKPSNINELYDYIELSLLLNVNISTIVKIISRHGLKIIKLKGKNYIYIKEFNEYLIKAGLYHFAYNRDEYYSNTKMCDVFERSTEFFRGYVKRHEIRNVLFNGMTYYNYKDYLNINNKDGYYSYNDIMSIFKISYDSLRNIMRKEKLETTKINGFNYIEKNIIRKYIEDNNLEGFVKNREGYETIKYYTNKFGGHGSEYKRLALEGKIRYVIFSQKYYLDKHDVMKYVKDKEYEKNVLNDKSIYLSIQDVAEILGTTYMVARKIVLNQRNKITRSYKNAVYISKRDVDVYIRKNNLTYYINNKIEYVSKDKCYSQYNCPQDLLQQIISENSVRFAIIGSKTLVNVEDLINFMFKNGLPSHKGDNGLNKKDKPHVDLSKYYSIKDLMTMFDVGYSSIKSIVKNESLQKKIVSSKCYIKKVDVEEYIEKSNLIHFIENRHEYITKGEIIKQSRLPLYRIDTMVKNNIARSVILMHKMYIYFPDVEKNKYFNLPENFHEYSTISEIATEFGVSKEWIRRKIANGMIKDVYKKNKKYFISKKEFVSMIKEIESEKNDKDNLEWKIEKYIKSVAIEKKLTETAILAEKYLLYKISRFKMRNEVINKNIKKLGIFISNINKEVYDLKNEEIIFLYKTNILTKTGNKIINSFLKFTFKFLHGECKYSKTIDIKEKYNTLSTEIYTKDDWFEFLKFSLKLDLHMHESFYSRRYAETWLFVLFHFSNGWRASDIIKLPAININIVERPLKDTEDFKITIEEARKIYAQLKLKIKETHVTKTNAKLVLVMPEILLITTMTALLLCSFHSSMKNINTAFSVFRHSSYPTPKEYKSFFKNHNGEQYFSSRRSNKSFITYVEEYNSYISDIEEKVKFSGTKLRSHQSVNTTEYYIDKKIITNDITVKLCDRGNFGWLYNALLDICNSNKSFNKRTNEIVCFKNCFKPDVLENLSGFFIREQEEKKLFIENIFSEKNIDFKEKLRILHKGELYSLTENVSCVFPEKCTKQFIDNCMFCHYSIPNTYALISLDIYIKTIFEKFKKTREEDVVERTKFTKIISNVFCLLEEGVQTLGEEVLHYIDKKYIVECVMKTQHLLMEGIK